MAVPFGMTAFPEALQAAVAALAVQRGVGAQAAMAEAEGGGRRIRAFI